MLFAGRNRHDNDQRIALNLPDLGKGHVMKPHGRDSS
jgi:hypothetical protein